jgi:hypothetical protein
VVFGVGLDEVMQRPGESSIPSVLKQMVAYLSELGTSPPPILHPPVRPTALPPLGFSLSQAPSSPSNALLVVVVCGLARLGSRH